ncbi:MAG: GNAT family N-acetyltransferase [Desulfobacterales bacterium]|nr:GNAT family N-acetyltransferase [Desulfobacterales bacterium]
MDKQRQAGPSDLALRFAEETDVEVLLGLIRGLADYERLSHEVTADVPTLRRSLFGGRPAAEAVLAESAGVPVGFALFFQSFSTFLGLPGIYIEDLYVEPAWRGRGIGRELLRFVARRARERGCGRLEWSVLDWNEPAIAFYRKLGGRMLEEWRIFRVVGEALEALGRP